MALAITVALGTTTAITAMNPGPAIVLGVIGAAASAIARAPYGVPGRRIDTIASTGHRIRLGRALSSGVPELRGNTTRKC